MTGEREAGPAVADDALGAFLQRAPKTEVHAHLEGALPAAVLDRLARRHGRPWGGAAAGELAGRLSFRSGAEFFALFRWIIEEHLRTPEDYAEALRAATATLRGQGVHGAELSVSAGALLFFHRPLDEILAALDETAAAVEREGGPELRFVADGVRGHGPEPLARVVEALERLPRGRWPALGLAGAESAMPARAFAGVFADARRVGLLADVHAGEEGSPGAVWDALEELRADRLIHAVAAAGDPLLVRHLRDCRVPLALAPTSNVRLGAVASLAEHPVGRWLRAGLVVSVNTDDPVLLGVTLAGEIGAVAAAHALSQAEVEALVLGGLDCAFLAPAARADRLHAAALELDRLRETLGIDERLTGGPPRVVAPPASA